MYCIARRRLYDFAAAFFATRTVRGIMRSEGHETWRVLQSIYEFSQSTLQQKFDQNTSTVKQREATVRVPHVYRTDCGGVFCSYPTLLLHDPGLQTTLDDV